MEYKRKVDKKRIPTCNIMGVNIAAINMEWLVDYLEKNISEIKGDYMVFVDDLLLLRHTLLWTNDSHYKATPLICKRIDKNSTLDRIIVNSAMYNV